MLVNGHTRYWPLGLKQGLVSKTKGTCRIVRAVRFPPQACTDWRTSTRLCGGSRVSPALQAAGKGICHHPDALTCPPR